MSSLSVISRCHSGGVDGFAPVVGDAGDGAVVEFADSGIAVEAAVAVVAGPFDNDGVAKSVPAADFEGEFGEVAFERLR
jgi:hypothetical protein